MQTERSSMMRGDHPGDEDATSEQTSALPDELNR